MALTRSLSVAVVRPTLGAVAVASFHSLYILFKSFVTADRRLLGCQRLRRKSRTPTYLMIDMVPNVVVNSSIGRQGYRFQTGEG